MSDASLGTRGHLFALGFIALDVVLSGERIGHRAGGTAANVAANLAFLGWSTGIGGTLGADPAGMQVKTDLARSKVDVDWLVRVDDAQTPVVVHEVLERTHRFRFGCPTCGRRFPASRPMTRHDAEALRGQQTPDVLFFDRVSNAALLLAEWVRDAGGLVVFEPASLGVSDRFGQALECAHIVKWSDERTPQLHERLRARRGQLHIRTLASRGADWRVGGRRWRRVPAIEGVDVVDAGGAGDWMTAGVLAALPSLEAEELADVDFDGVMEVAQALAALSCTAVGARGLASSMSARQIRAALHTLVNDGEFGARRDGSTPLRSRRRSGCGACLAASD